VARRRRAAVGRFASRFIVALVIFGALVTGGVVMVNLAIAREVHRIPRLSVKTEPEPTGGANYLIVGSDSRAFVDTPEDAQVFGSPTEESGRRSDTIMVVHVEPKTGHTMIVSFPRDLWVNVPGIGNSKINASFNSDLGGGPDTVIAALKSNFGIDINHYLEVDFVSFQEIVNSIGSVPVYIDRPVMDDFTGFIAVAPGCYHLNGTQALAWVRSRHLKYLNPQTGRLEEDARADIGRIERQQDFIRRLMGITVQQSVSNPFKAREISDKLVRYLKVDKGFNTRDALDLARAFRSVRSDDTSALEFVTFPFTDGNAGGQAVLFPDRTAAVPILEQLQRFNGTAPAPITVKPSEVKVKVLNGSGRSGVAQQTIDGLTAAGFVKGGTGNDQRGRVAVSEVRYANGADAKARLVLEYVGASAKLVNDPGLKDADVTVVIGSDFTGLAKGAVPPAPTTVPAGSTTPGATTPATPPPDPAAACH
jgi:LCP family protein required for cell wall assembly